MSITSNDDKFYLKVRTAGLGDMYGLPKVNNANVPLCPIL